MAELTACIREKYRLAADVRPIQRISTEITEKHNLTAEIREKYRIVGNINPVQRMSAEIRLPTIIREGDVPIYRGETEFVPSWEQQTIETENKLVESNISISSIQYFEVSNDAGGITLSI